VAEKVAVEAEAVPSGGTARKKKLFASGGYLELALAKSKKAAWYSCCQPCHL